MFAEFKNIPLKKNSLLLVLCCMATFLCKGSPGNPAYTLQGWLKAINPGAVWHTEDGSCAVNTTGQDDLVLTDRTLQPPVNGQYTAQNGITFGPGFSSALNDDWTTILGIANGNNCTTNNLYDGDGTAGSTVARDAMGLQLHYFGDADYTPINGGRLFGSPTQLGTNFKPLYNGNIAAMTVSLPKLGGPVMYNYAYDQLNRLIAVDAYKGLNTADANWVPIAIDDYKERYSYDPDGNILTLNRNGTTTGGNPLAMDNLTYSYKPNTNQLDHVNDQVAAGNYPDDIDNQTASNYGYDGIGNLVRDDQGKIGNISWTVYGKIQNIAKTDGTNISYTYDASGNRISKIANGRETWYVRDATGNVMATYTKGDITVNNGNIVQSEVDLYGSSRIGVLNSSVNCGGGPAALSNSWDATITRGQKFLEITNHLGNVLATVSDRLVPVPNSASTLIDHYLADVVNEKDYYGFGMAMPGRSFTAGNAYPYGFNGKMDDKDISDGAQDYGARINDTRLGRFLSTDPLTRSYPMLTPYQYASNDPIESLDFDGLERMDYRLTLNPDGSTKLTFLSAGPKTDKVTMANHGSWADILPAGTETVPLHYRIEYNGQHYIFNGGGPKGNVANLPVASKYAQYPSAVNYIGQMADFVKKPEAYVGPFVSEEESGVKQFQQGVAIDMNMQALEAIVTTGVAAGVAALTSRQATAANNGNPNAANSNTGQLNFKSPLSKRHSALSINQKSFAKEMNTVALPSVNMEADAAEINSGNALKQNNQYHVNGRIYGEHDGTLYPISGKGLYQLDRGAYKALGVLNDFGDGEKTNQILTNMKMKTETILEAKEVYNQIKPSN